MSALVLLVLAAAELSPPPVTDVPPPQAPVEAPAAGPLEPSRPDVIAQASFVATGTLHGAWLGLYACATLGCQHRESPNNAFLAAGFLGAGVGAGLSLLGHDLARDWGRAALLDSGSAAAVIFSNYLSDRLFLSFDTTARYGLALLTDLAVTAGFVALAANVRPRPESVWLADSMALWGSVIGFFMGATFSPPTAQLQEFLLLGAVTGGLAGSFLAATTRKMTAWRVLAPNALALLGALAIGGGFALSQMGSLFDSRVANVGTSAVIAAGFAIGFVISEDL